MEGNKTVIKPLPLPRMRNKYDVIAIFIHYQTSSLLLGTGLFIPVMNGRSVTGKLKINYSFYY